jgi:hypothetical protein
VQFSNGAHLDVKDIEQWVENIGMGAYTGMFRDSNINGIQLFSLDDASLLNMGVKVWSAFYLDVDRSI